MTPCALATPPHHHEQTPNGTLTAFFIDPDGSDCYIAVRHRDERIVAYCRGGLANRTARDKHNDYLCQLMLRLDAEAQLIGDEIKGRKYDLPLEDFKL